MKGQSNHKMIESMPARITLAGAAIIFLIVIYLFQRISYLSTIYAWLSLDPSTLHPNLVFIVNKTLRLILNDIACFALIAAIFQYRKYVQIAFYVFVFELIIVLPLYFAAKLTLEGDSEISSPLLSHLHRIIVNPTLMVLLIAGFIYQRLQATASPK